MLVWRSALARGRLTDRKRSGPLTSRTHNNPGCAVLSRITRSLRTHHGRTQPMTKHDEARRAFLVGAAVGAGAVAGATLVPDALAQTHDARTTGTGTGPAHSPAGGPGLGAFFNSEDAATVAAFAERLVPGAPGKPGARDTDVLNYIDLALSGAYARIVPLTVEIGAAGAI